MKKVTLRILCLFVLIISFKAQSQVKIGDNAKNINPNSLLELESSNKGFLIPRLTNNQIKAMTNVPVGMMLFSTTDSVLYVRKDTGWAILAFVVPKEDKNWANNGNDIYNTNGGKVGIGTRTPYSQLSNVSYNVLDKEGYGGNTAGSFNWVSNGFGYAGMISNFGDGRGLLVRTSEGAGNSLEVDAGDHNLLNVLASGNVGIGTSLPANKLSVLVNDTGYIASFQNTNNNTGGDGIKIKLGKTHPMWNGSSYYQVTLPNAQIIQDQIDEVKGLIQSHGKNFSAKDILNLTPDALYAGTTIQITNLITEKLNTSLKLPKYSPSTSIDTHIPKVSFGPDTWHVSFGKLGSFDTHIPKINTGDGSTYDIDIPKFEVFPSIPQIPTDGLPQFTFPNIPTSFATNVLDHNNEFLNFSDKDDRQLGSVIAEAPKDWLNNYLDPATITGIVAYVGGIDLAKDYLGLLASATGITENFNQIGVEYTSGHGDYAEWLERQDKDEFISAGDIVAVKGGKITKDLKGAEQVMVVSHKPVVLGNTPPEGKEGTGNKVAFMGQVPVKIMGPVNSGDYILAEGNVPGYGVAKNPSKMTALDFKLSVGRSWVQNTSEGPKMVNTLIGVDNGDYLKILQNNQQQINETNKKVDEITKRLLMLEKAVSTKVKSTLSNFSKN